ncbi:hypothetical protein [Actinomadura sediminis]|uniref:Copper chaperone PCu(A)C n=1 Tax=Actinomadura sediminis TaxID=1038904 RepID=A0ABW3ER39_9ACTN
MIRNSRRVVTLAVAGAVAIAPVISGCGAGMTPQSAAPTRLTAAIDAAVPQEGPTEIALRNMFLLGPEPGRPTPTGSSLALYGVLINQVKGRADRLVAVSSPMFADARIQGGAVPLPAAQPDGEGGLVKLLDEGALNTAEPSPGRGDQSETPPPAEAGETTPTVQPTGPGATSEATQSPTSENTAGTPDAAPTATGRPGTARPRVVLSGLKQELVAGALVPIRLQFEKAGAAEIQVPLVPHQQEYATYPLVSPQGTAQPGTTSPRPDTGQSPTGGQTPDNQQNPTGEPSPGGGEQTPGRTETPATGEGAAGGH